MTDLSEVWTAEMMESESCWECSGAGWCWGSGSWRRAGVFYREHPAYNSSLRNALYGRSEFRNAREACGLSSPCESINMCMFTWSLIHTPDAGRGFFRPSCCHLQRWSAVDLLLVTKCFPIRENVFLCGWWFTTRQNLTYTWLKQQGKKTDK